jgi:sulfonate transport system permease protein
MALRPPLPRGRIGPRLRAVTLELWLPIVLVAVWWWRSEADKSLFFPPLPQILSAFRKNWLFRDVPTELVPTLERLAMGLALAVVAGIALGIALGLIRPLYESLTPILEFCRAVPGVALLPLAILLLGIGTSMKVSVIAYGAVWPVLLNTVDGVRGVDPLVRDVARSYQLTPWQRVWHVVLPAASPQIVAGVRTALSIAITVIVFSEMIGSTNGVGYTILQDEQTFAVANMWSGIILLGILGYLLSLIFRGVEAHTLRWHRGMRAAGKG